MDKLCPRYFPLIEVGDGIRMAMIPTDDPKVIKKTCKYYLSESPLHTYRLIANGRDEDEEFDVCCPYCNSVMSPITIIGDIKLVTYVCERCNFRDLNRKKGEPKTMKITNYYSKALENTLRNRTKTEDHNFLSEGSTGESSFYFPIDEEILKKDNLFRRYATVISGGRSDGKIVATVSNAKAAIMEEGSQYPEQPDSFKEIRFASYKIGSLAKIKDHFVRDNGFDVKAYLSAEFSRRFGKEEEYLFLNGSGVNEPTGLLKSAKVGATTTLLTASSVYDALVSLYFSIGKDYRGDAIWIMGDETAMKLRKVKDNDGNPLWNHANDTIFGRPVAISPYMEDASKPILFGDLSFFWMIIRKPLSVMVLVERYAATNDIGYAANERLDSKLVREDAIKALSLATEG